MMNPAFKSEHLRKADEIYSDLVKRNGLYGYAYFGFARSNRVQRKLNRLWLVAKRQARENA